MQTLTASQRAYHPLILLKEHGELTFSEICNIAQSAWQPIDLHNHLGELLRDNQITVSQNEQEEKVYSRTFRQN